MAKKVAKKAVKKSKSSIISAKIAKVNKDLERAKEKALKSHSALFYEAVEQLFEEHKELKSFRWDQYTPHWNDGDSCEFSCHFDSLVINDESDESRDELFYTDLYNLERLYRLLSDRERQEKKIRKELESAKDKWEIERLNRDLEDMDKYSLKVIEEKYVMKKAVYDVLEKIDESFYEDNFGEGTVVVTREGITTEHCEHD